MSLVTLSARVLLATAVAAGLMATGPTATAKPRTEYEATPVAANFAPSATGNPINNRDDIAGSSLTDDGSRQASVYNARTHKVTALPEVAGYESFATDINNRGVVSGYLSKGLTSQAVVWRLGSSAVKKLTRSGVTYSYGQAINDSGVVTGSFTRNGRTTALVWTPDTGRLIGIPDFERGDAINNRGWVLGSAQIDTPNGPRSSPKLWRPRIGTTTLPIAAGDDGAVPIGLNDAGQIVGSGTRIGDPTNGHPISWTSRTKTPCALPEIESIADGAFGESTAINNRGQIVGSVTVEGRPAPTTWRGCGKPAVVLPTDGLDALVTAADGINDRGRILGSWFLSGATWAPRSHS